MNIFLKAALLALTVIPVMACSKEYIRDSPLAEAAGSSLICLQPQMGVELRTKAGVAGIGFPLENEIIMSALHQVPYGPAVPWFNNVCFERDGDMWVADKYWPLEGSLSLLAYSAHGLHFDFEPVASQNLEYWDMDLPADYKDQQVDILFASGSFFSGMQPAELCFRHAMAQLVFTAVSNVAWDEEKGKGVIIDDITVNEVFMDGGLRLYTTGDVLFDESSSEGAVEHLSVPGAGSFPVPGTESVAGCGLLVPPQECTSISVTYTVRDGMQSVQHTVDYELEDEWYPNELYSYRLVFDGENLLMELTPKYIKISSSTRNCIAVSNPAYNNTDAPVIEYSLDGVNWQRMPWYTGDHGYSSASGSPGFTAWTVNIARSISRGYLTGNESYLIYFDSEIYLRGNNPDGLSYMTNGGNTANLTQIWFREPGGLSFEGDLKYLLSYTENLQEVPEGPYCFGLLFGGNRLGCSRLPDLRVKTIKSFRGLYKTFYNFQIGEVPVLSATTVSERCYESTFELSDGYAAAPELPIVNIAPFCCYRMFYGSSIQTPPAVLPATELQRYCYYSMFAGSQVTTTPLLPSEQTASDLVQTEGCYNGMFENCTSLTETRDIALKYYYNCNNMFKGCSQLSRITTYDCDSGFTDWVDGVASSGCFVITTATLPTASQVNARRNSTHIPPGWQVLHRQSGYIWNP